MLEKAANEKLRVVLYAIEIHADKVQIILCHTQLFQVPQQVKVITIPAVLYQLDYKTSVSKSHERSGIPFFNLRRL